MPVHIDFPDHCPDEVPFQDLINGWCNEGLGQFFMDEKKALETEVDGQITKHHQTLNPHGTFTVPTSLDGFSRRQEEYVLVVLICHNGHNHLSGTLLCCPHVPGSLVASRRWPGAQGDPKFDAPDCQRHHTTLGHPVVPFQNATRRSQDIAGS